MKFKLKKLMKSTSVCFSLALLCAQPALSEDIDLFAGSSASAKPNIMLVLDSSAAWNATLTGGKTKFFYEVQAINGILDKLGECDPGKTSEKNSSVCDTNETTLGSSLRLGLTLYTETGTNGGYVRFAARVMNKTNRDAFRSLTNGLISNGNGTDNSGSNRPLAKTFFEMFKYYGGYSSPALANSDQAGGTNSSTAFGPTAFAGWGKDSGSDKGSTKRDHKLNTLANRSAVGYGATVLESAFDNASDQTYHNPISNACAKNFIIFISNAEAGTAGDTGGGTTALSLLTAVGGNTTTIKSPDTGTEATPSLADEFARFLYETDVSPLAGRQNVITYAIAVYDKTDENKTPEQKQINQAISIARAGGGKYYPATDGTKLVNSLLTIINEIQSVNSTFVTASLPVNNNAQGEFLNQVFIGMFRPDSSGKPRWWGNIKQYRLACILNGEEKTNCKCEDEVCPTVELVDAQSNVINSSSTGFIAPSTKSYWTSSSTFWENDIRGTPANGNDSPDGEVVEKGGAAQRLRTVYATSQDDRKIYTCATESCFNVDLSNAANSTYFKPTGVTGSAFSATEASASKFFTSTSQISTWSDATYSTLTSTADKVAALNRLILWTRGLDNSSDENGPNDSTVTVRPSIHADVIHSRPVAIDYGGTTGVVIFYGTNDGLLHAIKGSQTASDGGNEVWSFIAPEFYGNLNRLRVNTPAVKMPDTSASIVPTPKPKNYGFDGPITAFRSKDGKTYLYAVARRGGALLYAFDVTDVASPKLLWKISNQTSGFSSLGMTFSTPTVIQTKASTTPLIVFGGGYDGGYDSNNAPICEDARISGANNCSKGKGIYFINAKTGALVKHISSGYLGNATQSMDYSIPSDVYNMDSNFDGFIDRLYVGDVGGYLWRVEIDDVDPSKWVARVLANFGNDKKIFYRPAILQQRTYTVVAVGTGNRENPLYEENQDYFYMIKDTSNNILAYNDRTTALTPNDLMCTSTVNNCTSQVSKSTYGWKRKLDVGEKVVNSPRVAFGIMNFATNKPKNMTTDQCSNLGEARSYQLHALGNDAGLSALSNEYITLPKGGLPPTAFVGTVKISNEVSKTVIIGGGTGGDAGGDGGNCVGPTCAQSKTLDIDPVRSRKYRYNKVVGN